MEKAVATRVRCRTDLVCVSTGTLTCEVLRVLEEGGCRNCDAKSRVTIGKFVQRPFVENEEQFTY